MCKIAGIHLRVYSADIQGISGYFRVFKVSGLTNSQSIKLSGADNVLELTMLRVISPSFKSANSILLAVSSCGDTCLLEEMNG